MAAAKHVTPKKRGKAILESKVAPNDLRPIVKDSDEHFTITITEEHVRRATCQDPGNCVIAQALKDHFRPLTFEFQVGSNITKIHAGNVIIRFSTPGKLAKALVLFDKTKKWHLPPGQYTLLPLAKSYRRGARWNKLKPKAKRSGGKQDAWAGYTVPSRRTKSVTQLCAA